MAAVKCILCEHLESLDGTSKAKCALGKFDRPTRSGAYQGSYTMTSLAMGTPFLRQLSDKCEEYQPK